MASAEGDGDLPRRLVSEPGCEDVWAQDKPKEPPKLGWSNSTDLSLVVTAGNSAAQTWGFSDELRHVWKDARFKFEANVVRSDTSDDRFFQVAPGLEFPVGGAPANPATSLVKPEPDPGCRHVPPPRKLRTEHHPEILLERGRELGPQRRCRHPEPVHRACRCREHVGGLCAAALRHQLRHQLHRSRRGGARSGEGPPLCRRPSRLGLQGAVQQGNHVRQQVRDRTSISPIHPTTRSTPPAR